MEKKLKALRVAALLSAVSGASALLISGATPAKAAEERLHNSSYSTYGLIPPGENTKDSSTSSRGTRSDTTSGTTMTKSASFSGSKPGSSASGNEPKLEDPPMPSYDGPKGGNTMASNDVGGGASISN